MKRLTDEEDSFRKSSRRIAGIGFMLFGIGILIMVIGTIIAIALILSTPSYGIPGLGMGALTAEAIRAIAGIVLVGIGIVFYFIFTMYAGFKGRSVVSKVDLAGWESYVRNLGIMYFIATLLVVIGIFIIPGTSIFYKDIILMLISSILLMVSALLVPFHKQSIATGIILIIAAIFTLLPFQFPQLSQASWLVGSIPGLSQALTTISIAKILPAVSLMIVGVALILRGIIPKPLICHIIAAVGGLIYVISVIYVSFSTLSLVSETSSYIEMLSMAQYYMRGVGTVISALWTLYYTSIAGLSLTGIAGILGLIALLLVLVYIIKKGFASTGVTIVRETLYCPSCGAPVEPGDTYCRRCGRKLAEREISPPPPPPPSF